eukprot:g47072.t1
MQLPGESQYVALPDSPSSVSPALGPRKLLALGLLAGLGGAWSGLRHLFSARSDGSAHRVKQEPAFIPKIGFQLLSPLRKPPIYPLKLFYRSAPDPSVRCLFNYAKQARRAEADASFMEG